VFGKRLVQRLRTAHTLVEPPPKPLTQLNRQGLRVPLCAHAAPSYKEPIPGFETIKDPFRASWGPRGCAFSGHVSHQGHSSVEKSDSSRQSVERLKTKRLSANDQRHGGAAGNINDTIPKILTLQKMPRVAVCSLSLQNYKAEGSKLIKLLRRVSKIEGVKNFL
jgi:hypothetical protein